MPQIAQRGRFSPFLFKGTIFSSGGYSAQYGQGLSGAIILESDDLPTQSSASLSVSSVGIGGGINKLSKDSAASIGGDINCTNLYYNPERPGNEFMSDRTIPYNSLGLSAAYLTRIHKAFTVVVVSVSNVLGSRQVFGYDYSKDGSTRSAITMPASRFIFLGMFLSFGIDRSQDVINNNM